MEFGQRVKKPRRRVVGNIPGMRRQRRLQKKCIGICRLELANIKWSRKIVSEDAFVDADRTVELIVVEETATAARRQHGPVSERGQGRRKVLGDPARALL